MKERPFGKAEVLDAIADEVEAGNGPIALVRPGHSPVVLVSAEDWQRLDELESSESTAWWRRDAAERRMATGEEAGEGEDEPGLDEGEFRRRSAAWVIPAVMPAAPDLSLPVSVGSHAALRSAGG